MFTINNGIVIPNPETLGIWPFSEIYNRDHTSHKDRANLDWKFIEYYCSPKDSNPFSGYPKGVIRRDKIVENIRKTVPEYSVESDNLIIEAIDQYMEFWHKASPSLSYYESNLFAMSKLEDFFNNLDMTATNIKTGAPIYKPKEITSAIADAKTILTNLKAIKEQVYQEVYDSTKSKGNRQVNHFER